MKEESVDVVCKECRTVTRIDEDYSQCPECGNVLRHPYCETDEEEE